MNGRKVFEHLDPQKACIVLASTQLPRFFVSVFLIDIKSMNMGIW